jgi:uncharacterized membrane protein YqjE
MISVTEKNQTHNYLLSQGPAIRDIMQEAYMIPTILDNATQGELQRYKNNYKALNLIKLLMMFGLNYVIPMMILLKLSRLIRTPIIDSIRLFLRNLMNLLMIILLG